MKACAAKILYRFLALALLGTLFCTAVAWADENYDPEVNLQVPFKNILNNETLPATSGNSGALSYTIPIKTAPGRGGPEPELALVYNSGSRKNSWVGIGWSLDLGSIERSKKQRIHFANNDAFTKKGIRFNFFRSVDKMVVVTRETDEILQHINLAADRNSLAGNLSYGKHRSLEISMALATGADLVMLDEPAAGMSVDETHYAVKLIRRLTDGKTMVLSNTTWMWSSPWPTGITFCITAPFWQPERPPLSGRIPKYNPPNWVNWRSKNAVGSCQTEHLQRSKLCFAGHVFACRERRSRGASGAQRHG